MDVDPLVDTFIMQKHHCSIGVCLLHCEWPCGSLVEFPWMLCKEHCLITSHAVLEMPLGILLLRAVVYLPWLVISDGSFQIQLVIECSVPHLDERLMLLETPQRCCWLWLM